MSKITSSDEPGRPRLSCASLEAFDCCRRRFELAYLRRLDWPGLSTLDLPIKGEPSRLGQAFHRLASDWLAGGEIDPADVEADYPALGRLWRQFYSRPPEIDGGHKLVEQEILLAVEGAVVVARPDLVWQAKDGRLTILDWKTSAPSPAQELAGSCQGKLYPYLLVEAAESLGLGPVEPAAVEMVFYFVREPDHSVRMEHSEERHFSVGEWLRRRVCEVLAEVDFPLTTNLAECAHCRYQTYCFPGGVEGGVQPVEEDLDPLGVEYIDYF